MATRLYGILWRWHFLAGLVACPVLLVLAVTGALYVFQPELERALAPELHRVEVRGAPLAVDELVTRLPAGCAPRAVDLHPDPARSVEIWCAGEPRRRVFLDPYTGEVLGDQVWEESLFGVVLDLHWDLLLDDTGRLIVEWATSWGMLLMLSGAYLWWPRGRRGGGAWWPRRGVAPRQRLRDLHAIGGAYALPLLLAIAATGLFWTKLAGEERWKKLYDDVVERTWEDPPRSSRPDGAERVGYDAAIAGLGIDRARDPRSIDIRIGDAPDAPYVVFLFEDGHGTPWRNELVWVDAYSGQPLTRLGWQDRSTLAKINDAGYAVHVGAIGGLAGRLLALVAALVLAASCITGPWMWWKRRPAGKLGVPPRARRFAWPLLVVLAGLGWLLPTVGWTLVAVVALELAASGWRIAASRLVPAIRGR